VFVFNSRRLRQKRIKRRKSEYVRLTAGEQLPYQTVFLARKARIYPLPILIRVTASQHLANLPSEVEGAADFVHDRFRDLRGHTRWIGELLGTVNQSEHESIAHTVRHFGAAQVCLEVIWRRMRDDADVCVGRAQWAVLGQSAKWRFG